MAQEEIKNVVGDSFEDLKVDEMTEIQGAGDVDAETTPAIPIVASVITGAVASFEGTVAIAKTCKGSC